MALGSRRGEEYRSRCRTVTVPCYHVLLARVSHRTRSDLRGGEKDPASQWEDMQSHFAKGQDVGQGLWEEFLQMTYLIPFITLNP